MLSLLAVVVAGAAVFLAADRSGRPVKPRSVAISPVVCGGIAGAIALGFSGSLVLLFLGPAIAAAGVGLSRQERKRRRRVERLRQMPVIVEVIARRLASGETVAGALASLDSTQIEVAGLGAALDRIRSGSSAAVALAETSGLLGAALYASELAGTDNGAAVERLADRLRSEALDGRAAEAQSGQQLASAAVMTLIPPVVSLLYALSDERAAHFYLHTPWGALVIFISFALSACGWFWMRYITRPREVV